MLFKKKLQQQIAENTSNKYVIHCMKIMLFLMIGIWILNVLNVFPINKKVVSSCMVSSLIFFALGMILWHFMDLNKKYVKYLIILWTVIITTIMETGLTFHAILASVLPILFCSLYSSKKLMIYTSVLTIISTFISVLVGYHYGICDANMTLLPGEPLSVYINEAGEFTRTHMNNDILFNLILFFIFPRCIIYTMCIIVCFNVGKLNRSNVEYARHMEVLAEIDGMTGLYNKSKYLSILKNEYDEISQVSDIFWDINNLKVINDTNGHEEGDLLIRTVATNILNLANENKKAFRIGGDEFIMILKDADEAETLKTIDLWKKNIDSIKDEYSFEISASIGYAFGHGKDLQELIKQADENMYIDKKQYHESVKN
jgi:diguanylate cyclase (GGDEF)-like protein